MLSRESTSSNRKIRKPLMIAAAMILTVVIAAAAILYYQGFGYLVVENNKTGEVYGRYLMKDGEEFSVGFVHSVNKSPLIDYYEIRKDGIYVVRTVYYGFGAGVQTQLEEGQKLEYGEDGSMIVTGFEQKMHDLVYFVGTVSDHTLTINGEKTISLRDKCGRNSMVRFSFHHFL